MSRSAGRRLRRPRAGKLVSQHCEVAHQRALVWLAGRPAGLPTGRSTSPAPRRHRMGRSPAAAHRRRRRLRGRAAPARSPPRTAVFPRPERQPVRPSMMATPRVDRGAPTSTGRRGDRDQCSSRCDAVPTQAANLRVPVEPTSPRGSGAATTSRASCRESRAGRSRPSGDHRSTRPPVTRPQVARRTTSNRRTGRLG